MYSIFLWHLFCIIVQHTEIAHNSRDVIIAIGDCVSQTVVNGRHRVIILLERACHHNKIGRN